MKILQKKNLFLEINKFNEQMDPKTQNMNKVLLN